MDLGVIYACTSSFCCFGIKRTVIFQLVDFYCKQVKYERCSIVATVLDILNTTLLQLQREPWKNAKEHPPVPEYLPQAGRIHENMAPRSPMDQIINEAKNAKSSPIALAKKMGWGRVSLRASIVCVGCKRICSNRRGKRHRGLMRL